MARGRIYRIPFVDIAVTAVQDFFEVVSASTKVTVIKELHLYQSSDVGDAAEEMLRVAIKSGSTTSGSGGASVTPVPSNLGDAAFAGTAERNNTTQATSGTIVTHEAFAFNIRAGFVRIFTPEVEIVLAPSARATVELLAAPTDSLTMSGVLIVEELG